MKSLLTIKNSKYNYNRENNIYEKNIKIGDEKL